MLIIFLYASCVRFGVSRCLSVDVQDVMGSHIVDYGGRLHRWRTNSEGQLLFDSTGQPLSHDSVVPLAQKGEGCNVEGTLIVKQVPGNFHVSAHAHGDLLPLLYDMSRGETLNCTHYIHTLMFGDSDELEKRVDEAAVAPLNGASKIAISQPEDQGAPRSYEYYIKVRTTKTHRNKQLSLSLSLFACSSFLSFLSLSISAAAGSHRLSSP